MTGQIPPYGKNFKHDRVGSYHPTLSDTIYILKIDEEWFIRSDKKSKQWSLFHGWIRNNAVRYGKVQPSMAKAMQLLLDGIAGGFYIVNEPWQDREDEDVQASDGNWHCIHERKAAAAGEWRTDQDWTSHC